MEPREFLDGHALGLAAYERVCACLDDLGPYDVRVTTSQIAFRRDRGFAYLWLPGRYLAHPGAEVVLTIALGRQDPSGRFKEVAHPSTRHWMHHLELRGVDDVDDEVAGWLREAYERAG